LSGSAQPPHLAAGGKSAAAVPTPKECLKNVECFAWTIEAEEALDKLKRILTTASILMPPRPVAPLLLYVAATTQVVSAAIVVERPEEGHALLV
jgi:hypothetical protein